MLPQSRVKTTRRLSVHTLNTEPGAQRNAHFQSNTPLLSAEKKKPFKTMILRVNREILRTVMQDATSDEIDLIELIEIIWDGNG